MSKNILKFFVLTILFFLLSVNFAQAAQIKTAYPRTANIYLKSPIQNSEAYIFAKYDVLIFHMLAQQNSAEVIKKIRQLNPKIKILVYIASEEFPISMYSKWDTMGSSGLFYKLLSGIKNDMWLKSPQGDHVTFWLDFWMLNLSDYPGSSYRWNDYLSDFVAKELLSSGLWDGVFYDNVWTEVNWVSGGNIDIDNDGVIDSKAKINSEWQKGMKKLFALTRQKANKEIIIMGNGDRGYYDVLNGLYIENFTDEILPWSEKMRLYKLNAGSLNPTFAIMGNTNLNNNNSGNYKRMRFGLSSALMENGYYAFDAGSNYHSEMWWYDEYDVNLGNPTGPARSNSGATTYKADVWRRDFDNGVAIVNSTADTKNVDLGGDFEKIRGTQDKFVNDGAIVSSISVAPNDGQIMLKAISSLDNVLFRNGDFVRFFNAKGERVRNGFFVFENGYQGGDRVGKIDLNNNGQKDLVVVSGAKIRAWRDDGQVMLNIYPFEADFAGELKVALGDLNGDGKMEIIVGPSTGYKLPIKIYSYDGSEYKDAWLPLGARYKNGYSLAIGNSSDGSSRIVVGTGKGAEPRISIYSDKFGLLKTWLAFEKGFLGGVNVAIGDVDGAPGDEIIVGAGKGGLPIIKVFDFFGKQLYKEFRAYQATARNGIEVMAADVNFDGKADIIAESSGF